MTAPKRQRQPGIPKAPTERPVSQIASRPAQPPAAAPKSPERVPLDPLSTRIPASLTERIRWATFTSRKSQQQVVIEALDAALPPLPEDGGGK